MESKNLMLTDQRRISRIFQYHLARSAEPELPKTALCTFWKINGDHLALLVSSNREDFAYYQYNENNDTSLIYAGEFRLPHLLGFRAKGYGVRATTIKRQNTFAPTLCFAQV